jgi:hypothetical protein
MQQLQDKMDQMRQSFSTQQLGKRSLDPAVEKRQG